MKLLFQIIICMWIQKIFQIPKFFHVYRTIWYDPSEPGDIEAWFLNPMAAEAACISTAGRRQVASAGKNTSQGYSSQKSFLDDL